MSPSSVVSGYRPHPGSAVPPPVFVDDSPTVPFQTVTSEQAIQLAYLMGARERKRRNPVLTFVVIVAVFLIVIAVTTHGRYPAAWLGLSQQPALPVSVAPPAPGQASAAGPQDPVPQGVPESVAVWRGTQAVLYTRVDGTYTPSGQSIDPPGDNPVLNTHHSQVGTGQRTAVLAGHGGTASMPFTLLDHVQQGDVIDVKVGKCSVFFQADSVTTPDRGTWVVSDEPDTLELVSCVVPDNGKNVRVVAHRVSSSCAA